MVNIHSILWAFGSTAAAYYGTLCFQEDENSALQPPEVPKTGLIGFKMVDSSCSTQWQLSGDI